MLNRALVDVALLRIRRLLVMMPPQHGKSMLISQYFPAWYLGLFPDNRVILSSYEADFASQWGRKARDVIEQDGQDLFSISVRPTSSASSRWDILGHEGGMMTAGVGGPLTGKGADLGIIDDPIKNAEEANSLTVRNKIWEWYESTFATRIHEQGSIVIIMTRWHQDDLMGRLLNGKEKWATISLPAIAEQDESYSEWEWERKAGEALCPELYSLNYLRQIREARGSYWWNSLYQQHPQPREGGMFKVERIEIKDVAPVKFQRVVRYWDKAATAPKQGRDPDYTVGVKIGIDATNQYWILDVVRLRANPRDVELTIYQTAKLDGFGVAVWMEQEPGSAGVDVISRYQTQVLQGYAFHGHRETGDKALRSEGFAAQIEAGNVKLIKAGWNRDYLDELRVFPNGTHDDQVDASSGSFRMMQSPVGGISFL